MINNPVKNCFLVQEMLIVLLRNKIGVKGLRWNWAGILLQLNVNQTGNIIFLKMKTKSPSDLLMDQADFSFKKWACSDSPFDWFWL